MTTALDRCTAALGHPNVRAFLGVIREGESGHGDDAYTVINGGAHFTAPPWRHPWHGIPTTQGARASGAYQFLGTTWARCSDALGFGGDFAPINQDLAAVYLIDGRGALADVLAGNLTLAIGKLAQEWVSLPDLGLARAQRVFLAHGGAYAATQEGQGEAIPPPEVSTPIPTEKKPMLPLLLPALLQAIPQLIGIFGKSGERAQQNAQAVQIAVDAVTKATEAVNLQAALEKMQADPEAKAKATAEVLQVPAIAALLEATEAGGGGIAAARKAAADPAAVPFWKAAPFYVSLLLLALVGAVVVDVLYVHPGNWRPEDRAQILMFAVAVASAVSSYFLGSSISSARKDAIIARQ